MRRGRHSWWSSRAALSRLLLVLAVCGLAAGAVGQQVKESPAFARLQFGVAPTDVRLGADGRDLLLIFAKPLPNGEAGRAGAALGSLVGGVTEGYASVRYTFERSVRLQWDGRGRTRSIEVIPLPTAGDDADGRLRLQIVEARVAAEDGDVAGALRRLKRLSAENPDKVDPALALADLEAGQGQWQHALGVYDGVLSLFPEAADIARDRRALAIRLGPQFRLDGLATFGPGKERVQTATATVEAPLAETWRVGASFQVSHDEIRGLRQSARSDVADYSGTKLLTDLDLVHDWGPRVGTTRADLVVAPQTVGARLQHQITTSLGESTVAGVFHQPYWGTVMAFAANAVRDQFGVAQTISLPHRLQATLGAGVVRYGLPNKDDVASGSSVTVGLSEGLPKRWLPLDDMQARIGWRMEAEYLGNVATNQTAIGFLPLLDVRKRENHDLYGEASATLLNGVLLAQAGYVFDRFGGNGPQALLRYTRGDEADWFAFGAEAGVDPSLDVRTRTLFHLGAFAVFRLGAR